MEATIDELISRLRTAERCDEELALVQRWADAGRIDELLHLGEALLDAESGAARSVRWQVTLALAARPGAFSATAVLQLVGGERGTPAEHRIAAARLAEGQPLENLDVLFADAEPSDELLACLLQETVLRHGDLSAVPEAVAFAERLHGAHPLGVLPLRLAEFEQGEAPGEPYRALPLWPEQGGPEPVAKAEPLAWTDEAAEGFQRWVADSNGKIDSGAFRLSAPWQPDLLAGLPLDCVAGAERIEVRQVTLAEAFAEAFHHLRRGGAYTSGQGGAYARLYARQALARLADVPRPGEADCQWWQFTVAGPWFYDEEWSLGLLAARPDGTVAALAVTDTD